MALEPVTLCEMDTARPHGLGVDTARDRAWQLWAGSLAPPQLAEMLGVCCFFLLPCFLICGREVVLFSKFSFQQVAEN